MARKIANFINHIQQMNQFGSNISYQYIAYIAIIIITSQLQPTMEEDKDNVKDNDISF